MVKLIDTFLQCFIISYQHNSEISLLLTLHNACAATGALSLRANLINSDLVHEWR